MEKKVNVMVYALPNVSGGGYSVIENLYKDIDEHKDAFPEIHWHFIVGRPGLEDTECITVHNEEDSRRSYFSRVIFNAKGLKRYIEKYDIRAIISINMLVGGVNIPSIISFHNVLPFYHCGFNVFDRGIDIVKQMLINRMIIESISNANYVVIPSKWIEDVMINRYGIRKEKIRISPIGTPEMCSFDDRKDDEIEYQGEMIFVYPASGFPYKNHMVIAKAVERLKADNVSGFKVLFTGEVGNGKTMRKLKKIVQMEELPIEFYGMASRETLASFYRKGVLIFPSKIETDGFPLLESMACGGKIIAADMPYAREALSGYEHCEFFCPDDAQTLAEYMKNMISQKSLNLNRVGRIANVKPRSEVIVSLIREIVEQK